MSRRKRKLEMDGGPGHFCDFLVAKSADRVLAIGPLVWQPSDGTSTKQWYFIVGSGGADKQFHCDQVIVGVDTREGDRLSVLAELISRRPLVLHTFEDELSFARFCEIMWPCEKSARIRQSVEAEHQAWAKEAAAP